MTQWDGACDENEGNSTRVWISKWHFRLTPCYSMEYSMCQNILTQCFGTLCQNILQHTLLGATNSEV